MIRELFRNNEVSTYPKLHFTDFFADEKVIKEGNSGFAFVQTKRVTFFGGGGGDIKYNKYGILDDRIKENSKKNLLRY